VGAGDVYASGGECIDGRLARLSYSCGVASGVASEKQGVIPAYGFYVVYDGSNALSGNDKATFEKYTVRNRLVKLPYLDPMNLDGTVWRDFNGDDQYIESEGISAIKAKVSPKKDGTAGSDEAGSGSL